MELHHHTQLNTRPNSRRTLISGDAAVNYAENGTGPVGTYKANDPEERENVTWSLSGTDAGSFKITRSVIGGVPRGGVLTFKNPPDYEAKGTYDVTLQASDRKNDEGQAVQLSDPDIDAMFTVTVNVTDVNEAPSITTAPTDGEVSVDELHTGEVTRFEATDPETDGITWTLTGTDQDDLEIESDTGIVTLARTPDFEHPTDSNRNNSYVVTVEASDGKLEATQRLTVTVANVAEDGSVSFSSRQPQDGTPFTATLSDPDGRITGTTWTWERSSDKSNWTFRGLADRH